MIKITKDSKNQQGREVTIDDERSSNIFWLNATILCVISLESGYLLLVRTQGKEEKVVNPATHYQPFGPERKRLSLSAFSASYGIRTLLLHNRLQSLLVWPLSLRMNYTDLIMTFSYVSHLSASVGSIGSAIAIDLTQPQIQLILPVYNASVFSSAVRFEKIEVCRVADFFYSCPKIFHLVGWERIVLSVDFSTDKKNGESNSNSNSISTSNLTSNSNSNSNSTWGELSH